MKSSSLRFLRLGAAFAAAALLTAGHPLRAESDEDGGKTTASIKFSDPAKPGTLKALLPWADVRITGADVAEVTVVSSLNKQHAKGERREDGLRRLDEEVSFDLTEKDNVIVVQIVGDTPWGAQGSVFEIKVPRSTNLVVRTEMGGDVNAEGIEGDIDINSMNGDVVLRDVASSAIVNTMNGEISAFFKKAPVKPVSLSSMNGEIELRLPADTKASLRMRTHNGSLLTDFDEDKLVTKAETRVRHASVAESLDLANQELKRASRELARATRARVHGTPRISETIQTDKIATPTPTSTPTNTSTPGKGTETRTYNKDGSVTVVHTAPEAPEAPETPEPALAPVPPLPPIMGGKTITGTLNGGGTDIQLASMNGSITLRQTK